VWTLPTVTTSYGIVATIAGGASAGSTVAVTPAPASALVIQSGNNQSAVTGSTITVVAAVRDAYGNAVPNVVPNVVPVSGGGVLASSPGPSGSNGLVAIQLKLGTIGTNSFQVSAGSSAAVTVTATSLPLPMRVDFLSPTEGQTVPDSLWLSVYIETSYPITQASATIGGTTYPMSKTYPPTIYHWYVQVPTAGLVRGTTLITVNAANDHGQTVTATRTFFKDTPPAITIITPQANDVASPTLRIQATCSDDDPAGCATMAVFADHVCGRQCGASLSFQVTGGMIDTVVTFPRFSNDRGWTLRISGTDSRGQTNTSAVPIIVTGSGTAPDAALRSRRFDDP
jgi:hypothetical protein